MQMCKHHWSMLRKAIQDRGLSHLIAKDAAQLEKQGGDPLVSANIAIFGNAMMIFGPEFIQRIGDGCPICFANLECTCPMKNCADRWITYAARDEKEMYDSIRKQQAAVWN